MDLPITILARLIAKDRPFTAPKFELQRCEGPPHRPTFYFKVSVRNILAFGKGKTHKEARQNAAQAAVDQLTNSSSRACIEENKPLLQLPAAAVADQPLVDSLLSKIKKLDTQEPREIRNVCRAIILFCTSDNQLEIFINRLHDGALKDRIFGHQAAIAISTTSVLSDDGHRYINAVMTQLEMDVKNSEAMQATSPARFLNAVSFLGQVCKFVPLGSGILNSLLLELLKYQNRLVAGGPEEIELCVCLLALNSGTLYKHFKTKLEDLMITIIDRCLTNTLLLKCRALLNLARHLHTTGYKPIRGKIKLLFEKHLSPGAVDDINMLIMMPDTFALGLGNPEGTLHRTASVMGVVPNYNIGLRNDYNVGPSHD